MKDKEILPEEETAEVLCDVCGSVMIQEDNELVCPHCDGEIDYFGEDDEDTDR